MEFFVHENFFFKLIILLWQCSFAISADPLPYKVKPEVYTVEIYTNPNRDENESSFQGTVTIQVACTESTKQIIMDAVNLTIDNQNTRIWNSESPGNLIGVTEQSHLEGKFIINLDEALIPEMTYVIELKYSSPGGPVGYIVDLRRSESYVLTDKYAARHIFPCFDRIDLKADFIIYLKYEEWLNGFSMTQSASRSRSDHSGYVTEIFQPLVNPMSTYSVTLATTSLNCYNTEAWQRYTFSRINIRYCSESRHQRFMMTYVCSTIADILLFLSNFLLKIYPLNKFDILLRSKGPTDFSEGYGLVLTRSSYLTSVIDEPVHNPTFRYEGIKRLCYVLSHQWFGHIVTMDWEESWFHVGLNIYILWQWAAGQHETVENGPYLDYMWDIISSFLHIMKKEETEDWILMSTENSNWDSEPGSDNIPLRAALLLRMIDFFLGTPRFKEAIRQYLHTYQFKNTNLNLVWNSFTATVVNHSPPTIFHDYITVGDVMRYWINQNGHPLIYVQRDYETGQVKLRQEPFTVLAANEAESSQASEICWTIPLRYMTKGGIQGFHWFLCGFEEFTNEMYLPVGVLDINHWVLLDLEVSVLCRVQYDKRNWKLIQKLFLNHLEQYAITELNRVRIISDMFTLAKDGRLSYKIVLKTVTYLHRERSYGVWKEAIDELNEIRSRLLAREMSLYKEFKKYMRRLLEPMFMNRVETDYTFQRDNPSELNLSVLIMEQACTYGVKSCLYFGKKIINNHSRLTEKENSRIPYSINKAIHCQEVKRNNEHRDKIWDIYLNLLISYKIKELILMALGCTRDIEYLKGYLERSLNPYMVTKENDRLLIFKSVSLNIKGYGELRNFFENNYARLIQQPSEGTSTGHNVSIIPYWQIILDATHRQDDLNELIILAQQNNVDLQSEWMRKSIANAQRNIHWRKINKKSLITFFF